MIQMADSDRLLEASLPFGVCSFDVITYRDALGNGGLSRYRELAQGEWSKVKPRDAKADYDACRKSITRIMERLAEASGDADELVAIKAMDLSSPFHDIANIWTKAGQPDKALDWAERGMKAFPERPDNRLRDFLVAAYLERKRDDEAPCQAESICLTILPGLPCVPLAERLMFSVFNSSLASTVQPVTMPSSCCTCGAGLAFGGLRLGRWHRNRRSLNRSGQFACQRNDTLRINTQSVD